MSGRIHLWLVLAVGHLAVVIGGACYRIPRADADPPAQVLRWYAAMSGASSSYGFFAPSVGSPHRARFLLKDESGHKWWDAFDEAGNSEARLRLTGIVDGAFMSGAADESPEWRGRLVSSWAATMFSRHPDAVSLTVVVEAWYTPGMRDYQTGLRPRWVEMYRAEVQRHSPAEKARRQI